MLEPSQIIEESDREISIRWADETETRYTAPALRRACPCAGCVNEWTGEKILEADRIAEDLTFSSISIVGRYALNFHFSDSHDTGIYSFEYLARLAKTADA
jgi:DUF971 family protein